MANRNRSKGNRTAKNSQPATESIIKPGDYPLGSLESRAAARSVVMENKKEELVIQIVYVSPDGTEENGPTIRVPGFGQGHYSDQGL